MKKITKYFWPTLYFLIFFLGFGSYLPVFHAPDFLHIFFSQFGVYFHIPIIFLLFLLILLSLITKKKKKATLIIVVLYALCLFSIPFFQDIDNRLVIWINSGKKIENFKNPVLGMNMIKRGEEDSQYQQIGDVMFVCNDAFMTWDALVYSPDVNIIEHFESDMRDASDYKAYNEDWWWYVHLD